MHYIVYYK